MGKLYFSPQKKKKKKKKKKAPSHIFFSMGYGLLIAKEPLFWNFWRWKMRSFLRQKVNGKMIITDYWKVLVLKFLGMGGTVFFRQKNDGKRIFNGCWKVLLLTFSVMGNCVFFLAKK